MTMLTHTRVPFERSPASRRDPVGNSAAKARLGMIQRVCIGTLKVLAAAGAIAAIIGLKAVIYYWRFLH
jgi:hypothetical protein